MRCAAWIVLLTLVGCVTVREIEERRFDGVPISLITVDQARGDLDLTGSRAAVGAQVAATIWGRGSTRDGAQSRQDRVRWSADLVDEELILSSFSTDARSGVDFFVTGPQIVDSLVRVDNGRVTLDRVEGVHEIIASTVRGNVAGDVFIDAANSVDIDFFPFDATAASIDSRGTVTLGLPIGPDYDLIIRGNPNSEIVVEDLGWDDIRIDEGFFAGLRGRGFTRINIIADGRVRIRRTF